MRALFIGNPQATTATPRSRDVIVRALASDMAVDTVLTEYRGHARELVQRAAEEGYDLVVSFGGDGTVNEVVNGILALPAKQRPLYAALPGGSANVFVRALGLPANPVEATGAVLEALHSGSRRTVNLGHIDGPDGGRYFTFCAGFGWDAEVVHEVERQRQRGRRATPALYTAIALSLFLRGGMGGDPSLSVEVPGRPPVRNLFFVLVTNTTPWTYAGPSPVQPTPRSRFELDLDVFALTRVDTITTANVLRMMFSAKGVPPRGRGYRTWHNCAEFTIRSQHPRPFQIDGEYLGHRQQVNFRSVPKALRIVA
ncbi:diacylglycerol kinase, catalytic region [Thermobifida fusca YX]|uniref:Diacylglycerol kinase n=2 Tax=Thermobifida fusca TaxID=2021 RepID=A0A9P2WRM1_THEFU|nr:diacylglycerol kinase family protein [Thermobifida fusca]AAZ54595.1 diacylglycerol kinase, catalytic region [Thermobifida fusca YX]EOR72330.1 diacylglycerol kinase [Thermobifida fusca TM51]MDD6793632.1 diacylglycerol kinase family protein [Thermobifida fusca]PPS93006.1 DeoR family transcriptional regulator [Thermobifida fusca]PZN66757.1 MAG: diacylglycerol kinase [Thermobifida fusca]